MVSLWFVCLEIGNAEIVIRIPLQSLPFFTFADAITTAQQPSGEKVEHHGADDVIEAVTTCAVPVDGIADGGCILESE